MDNLRAPIGVVMGNVDAGKTKVLDYIRETKTQIGEAGGITQQIGATNLPKSHIIEKAGKKTVKSILGSLENFKIPGLLVIDTPGHGAFQNLRARGSAMCDIAILVVNAFDGIIGAAKQSIKMLKANKAPFIIALNQIDLLNNSQWESKPHLSIEDSLKSQTKGVRQHFDTLVKQTVGHFCRIRRKL
eukprot:UN34474